jgi:hypothetical protein
MQNSLSGPGRTGISYLGSNGIAVRKNTVSGMSWGILMWNNGGGVTSNDNIILGNTVTGITGASCIGLQGDADNNVIIDNTVTNNTNNYNAGIMLNGQCDGNVLNRNEVTYNIADWRNYSTGVSGCWITSGSNNKIGPKNVFSDNEYFYGIFLGTSSSNNRVFLNTALNNTFCDIVNEGTNNTFLKNTANCTTGVY